MTMPEQSSLPKLYLQDGARYWIAMVNGRVSMSAVWCKELMAFTICSRNHERFSVDEVDAVAPMPARRGMHRHGKTRSHWTPIDRCFLPPPSDNALLSQKRNAILNRAYRARARQLRLKAAREQTETVKPSTWVHPYRRLPSTTGSQ